MARMGNNNMTTKPKAAKTETVAGVKIDKGVALPTSGGGRTKSFLWPWHQMKKGDSFFASGYIQQPNQRTNGERLLGIGYPKRNIPDSEWTTRMVTENGVRGVRVWRVK